MKLPFILSFIFIIILNFITYSCKEDTTYQSNANNTPQPTPTYRYNDSTIINAYKEIRINKTRSDFHQLSQIYFPMGFYFISKNKSDSAFYYFNHAKEMFLLERDSSNAGKCLTNMTIIQLNNGDYFGSEETATEALKFLKSPENNSQIASVYNCLAVSKTEQKNYTQAIEYYNKSLEFPRSNFLDISVKNNLAIVNIKAKNYKKAIEILTPLVHDSILSEYLPLKNKITSNLAYAKWLNTPSYDAGPILYHVLHLRELENDISGQIANHSYLSKYFTKTNPQKALYHAGKMYKIATESGTPNDRLEALQKLIKLERPNDAKKHFNIYFKLNDSVQLLRNFAKNQFTLIRYEVEKNKEENLRLKAENAHKNYQILKQRVIVFSIGGIAILSFIISILWYKRKKDKFNQEKIEEVHRTEIKYSKKIHDEVANGIYHLMVQLENNLTMTTSQITDNLEELYNKSRNISHETEFKSDLKNNFPDVLRETIHPFGGENIKIILIGNNSLLWENISVEQKEEIYYVIIELMTNMKKHSKATLVTLKFKQEKHLIIIEYFDNGIGLTEQNWKPGKGLKNIENRINSIQGKVLFDIKRKKGFSVRINITI